jgi:hypothetical protein
MQLLSGVLVALPIDDGLQPPEQGFQMGFLKNFTKFFTL